MKTWLLCGPTNRQTLGSMRYILETCQGIKDFTHDRIFAGMRKANRKPLEQLISDWVADYVKLNIVAQDAPRYALKDAMREVLVNGIMVHPRERFDYNAFTVEPRPGWKKEIEVKKSLSWADYLEGKSNANLADRRTVTPEAAIENLFENGVFSFRWGEVELKGRYAETLQRIAKQAKVDEFDFLRKVKEIDFLLVKQGQWEDWKVHFNLGG